MRIPAPPPPHAWEPAPEERAFRFTSGNVARNLPELEAALRHAPPGTVWFHREHFVPWLRDVVGDEPLARRFDHYARTHAAPDVLRDVLADLVQARVAQLRGGA